MPVNGQYNVRIADHQGMTLHLMISFHFQYKTKIQDTSIAKICLDWDLDFVFLCFLCNGLNSKITWLYIREFFILFLHFEYPFAYDDYD